jgi:hypothetical protein
MVEKENITVDIQEVRHAIKSARMERRAAGAWILILDINGDITIDGGRVAGFNSETRISGKQKGRRPNPSRKAKPSGKLAKKRRTSERKRKAKFICKAVDSGEHPA